MDDNFKNFDKLFLADEGMVEAKLFDGPKNGQFLVDFQFEVDIFKYFKHLVVVHGAVGLLLLIEGDGIVLGRSYFQFSVDLVQFIGGLEVDAVVLGVVFNAALHSSNLVFLSFRFGVLFGYFTNFIFLLFPEIEVNFEVIAMESGGVDWGGLADVIELAGR